MKTFMEWSPPAIVGAAFTVFGALKLYGARHGIVGGGSKPFAQRVCGSCPTWSRAMNRTVMFVFLAIGVSYLAWAAWELLSPAR